MKLFYQPHPNIKPIVKDLNECRDYTSRVGKHTLFSVPLKLMISLPYTRTLEKIDNERLDGELKKRDVTRLEMTIEYIMQFDLDDARSEFGDRAWMSRIRVSIEQLNGHKTERESILISKLEHYYTEIFMAAREQDDFTNIGDLDEFRWCNIVKVVNDAEAERLEQERLQYVGFY